MIGPLVKTGVISGSFNMFLAVLIGILFGWALHRSGFSSSRKIGSTFYLKDVDVPIVMFTAIATGALGLWGMGLIGLIDLSKMYFLPTYLFPQMVAGFIFGIGMVVGGFCPGTSLVASFVGKIDGIVFLVGFLIGSLIFGDLFPIWKDFYKADFRGVFRLDQVLHINLGLGVFLVILIAVFGSLGLRKLQYRFWGQDDK